MTSLLDKLTIFLLCTTLFVTNTRDVYAVVLILAAITFSALESFIDRDLYHVISFCAFVVLSLFVPNAAFFLPVFAYDIFSTKWQWFLLLSLIPVSFFISQTNILNILSFILIICFILLSCILKKRTLTAELKQENYHLLRDEITEKQMLLEKANRELLEKQDYEVHLATLRERNRIAGELHDSIGHVLTRSLLQTGALLSNCPDEATHERLRILQSSLSLGMDEVRSSIHNLHDESVDLYDEVRARVNEFTFCRVTLRYNIDNQPDTKISYAFLSILKEGLVNIARHSNASEAVVILFEHPALYQLVIRDSGSAKPDSLSAKPNSSSAMFDSISANPNSGSMQQAAIHYGPGREFTPKESEGMGLPGIRQRVESLGGNVVFRKNQGFEIFVSVPKEKLQHEIHPDKDRLRNQEIL